MNLLLAVAEEETNLNPFSPEPGLYVWTLIAFLFLLFFLAKFVFPRLGEGLADRERRIKQDLESAEEAKKDAEKIMEDYKSKIAQAREESNRIIDEARQSAESLRKDLIAKAEADAREVVGRAQQQLEGERDRAIGDLQRQLAQWSTDIAGRIIRRELNPDSQQDLIESFIRDVGNGRQSGGSAQ